MAKNGTKKISAMEIDAIGEIMNISLGSSATAASTMLNARVDITTPIVEVKSIEEFEFSSLEPAVGVEITYVEGITGNNVMLLKRTDVKTIVEMMMGMEIPDDQFELDEMNMSAVCEIMNQMMGSSATALAELLSRTVNISTPVAFEVADSEDFKNKYFAEREPMVVIRFNLKIGEEMESEFLHVMPIPLAKELVSGFFPEGTIPDEDEEEEIPALAPASPESAPAAGGGDGGVLSQEAINAMLAESAAAPAAPEPAPAAGGGDGGVLSQEAINAMLAESAAAPAAPATPEPAPAVAGGGDGGVLSQEAINAMLAESAAAPAAPAAMPTPVPAPAPAVPAAVSTPSPAAAPAAAPVAPVTAGAPAAPVAPVQGVAPVASVTMDPTSAAMMQQMMDMMRQQMELQKQEMEQLKNIHKTTTAPKQIKVGSMPQHSLSDGDAILDPDANLDLIMGVPLDVSVEIGRTKKLVKDILEFNKGSLIVLNKLAGEQVDVFVNGQCIAKGDVVVVEDNFGVRITEIIQEEIEVEA